MTIRRLQAGPGPTDRSRLAAGRLYYRYDWEGAETGYNKAIALNPGYATAYQWLGELNNFLGRHEVALANIDKALSIAPFQSYVHGQGADSRFPWAL